MNAPLKPPSPKPWGKMTPAQKAELVVPLVKEAVQYREIARQVGAPGKSSVVSIVNWCRRHDLLPPVTKQTKEQAGRLHAKKRLNSGAPAKPRAPHPNHIRNKAESRKSDPGLTIPQPAAFAPLPGVEPVRLVDAEPRHCRWVVDVDTEEEAHFFCGAERAAHSSYCAFHRRLSLPAHMREDA